MVMICSALLHTVKAVLCRPAGIVQGLSRHQLHMHGISMAQLAVALWWEYHCCESQTTFTIQALASAGMQVGCMETASLLNTTPDY